MNAATAEITRHIAAESCATERLTGLRFRKHVRAKGFSAGFHSGARPLAGVICRLRSKAVVSRIEGVS
jgi:hypothetical protein